MSSSVQPVAARVVKTPLTGSGRSMHTLSNPSASEMPSQTDWRIAPAESVSVRREDTCSNWRSAALWNAAAAASWALCSARAAWSATATRPATSCAEGRRPERGSPTEMIPSRWPSVCRMGTKSSSSGCQASGLALGSQLGM